MLTTNEVQEHIARIQAAVAGLENDHSDLAPCVETHGRLEALRAQYRESPAPLTPYVGELTDLRNRFNGVLAARLAEVVDRFQAVTEEIHRAEQEKAAWRAILIEQAGARRSDSLQGLTAIVQIRTKTSRTLPPPASAARQELEELVRRAGLWEELSILSRPKLERSIDKGQFPAQTAAAIDKLCPAVPAHQVTVRSLE